MLHEEEPQRDDYLARVTGKASRQASMRSTRTATVERAGLICVKRGPIRDIQRRVSGISEQPQCLAFGVRRGSHQPSQ